jgi:hypothetical protein
MILLLLLVLLFLLLYHPLRNCSAREEFWLLLI